MAFLRRKTTTPSFKNSKILQQYLLTNVVPTSNILGTGSFGSVLEVTYGKLKCVAKKMHDILLQTDNQGMQILIQKYEQECQIMTSLRHPNITLFLGICFLPDTQLPLLVIERLDMSLEDLLEYVPNLPLTLKVTFLEDVSGGLDYLHRRNPPIVHGDLTAKNVLLTSSLSVKITDVGNSRIVSLKPGDLVQTLSKVPGALVYMPPEALTDDHPYRPSLDIFSLGHLALYIFIQTFPAEILPSTYHDPNNHIRVLQRSEIERRATYIEKLEASTSFNGQCLVDLVKQCLADAPEQRPSSENLVEQIHSINIEVEKSFGGRSLKHVDIGRVQLAKDMRKIQEKMELEMQTQMQEKVREIKCLQQEKQELREQMKQQEDELQQQRLEIRQQREKLREQSEEIQRKTEELQKMEAGKQNKRKEVKHEDKELRNPSEAVVEVHQGKEEVVEVHQGKEEVVEVHQGKKKESSSGSDSSSDSNSTSESEINERELGSESFGNPFAMGLEGLDDGNKELDDIIASSLQQLESARAFYEHMHYRAKKTE